MANDLKVPAVFVRGGTSRAVLFHASDLAEFGADQRDAIILTALGSPDSNRRQVDGLKPGMFARARIQRRLPAILSVPESAVLHSGRRKIVFVHEKNGKFRPRIVKPGQSY